MVLMTAVVSAEAVAGPSVCVCVLLIRGMGRLPVIGIASSLLLSCAPWFVDMFWCEPMVT
jgi:hypothetical protein